MDLLLISPCFSREASTGILVLKNLQDLGHRVKVWDNLIMTEPPEGEFDIAIVWINKVVDLSKVRAKKKVLYYLEDNDYIRLRGQEELTLDSRIMNTYDYIFTMNETPGFEDKWIPMGADTELFFPIQKTTLPNTVLFIGTGRDRERKDFVLGLQNRLKANGIRLSIVGNNWEDFNNWSGRALYYSDFLNVLNLCEVCVNIHAGELSPSDKVHAIISCGGALLINDNKESYKKCYPMAPVWNNIDDCVEKIKYFFQHQEERKQLVKSMRERCIEKYTYKEGLRELLRRVEL